LADVVEHDLAGDRVQFEMAASREVGEGVLMSALELPSGAAEHPSVAKVEAELLGLMADEVEDGEHVLALGVRSPRPSCCRNTVALSVGRSISTTSTAGTSMPSLNRSTVNSTCTRPARRSSRALTSLDGRVSVR
jgi:hypothetical protein